MQTNQGYCFCINKTISELLNILVTQVSKLVNSLKDKEYINIEMIYKGNSKEVDVSKNINVVFKDIDLTKEKMTNKVNAKIELVDEETKNEVEDSADTTLDVKGKVIVKYVDKDTGEEILINNKTLATSMTGKVGSAYNTEKKVISGYTFVEDTKNTKGRYINGEINVIYYYTKKGANLVVKYVDEDGKEIAEKIEKEGSIGEDYTTTKKVINGYEYVRVEGKVEGKLVEGTTYVTYVYKKVKEEKTKQDSEPKPTPTIPEDPTPEVENRAKAPKTGTNIMTYIAAFGISLVGIIVSGKVFLIKDKKNAKGRRYKSK